MFFSLLPATVLAIYFFWVKLPLAALCCMVFLVFVVERLIHTYYVFTDEGCLFIHQGRFSKVSRHSLSDIEKVDIVRPSSLSFLKNKDTVMLTFCDGSIKFITPFPAEEFCRYFKRKQEDFLESSGLLGELVIPCWLPGDFLVNRLGKRLRGRCVCGTDWIACCKMSYSLLHK